MPHKPHYLFALASFGLTATAFATDADSELAKKSQNPVGSIISAPIENTFHFDIGPSDSTAYVANFKPVYPINFGDINLINRFIIPFVHTEGQDQEDLEDLDPSRGLDPGFGSAIKPALGSETGLSDITYQGFFTPAEPGPIIWGVGPAITLPTHTDERFGSDKVSAGPAIVVLSMPGKWVLGGLFQHSWDVAGRSSEADVDKSTLQLFINYNIENGWYLTTSPIFTANWEADSDDRWKVPVGGGIGKMHRFGKQPVDFKLTSYYNVEQSEFGPDWEMTFTVKWLFPK